MHDQKTDTRVLTTGQAASFLMVTRDTVLKWVRQGRISAFKTMGGHYRIPAESLHSQFRLSTSPRKDESEDQAEPGLYCWEYHSSDGFLKDQCRGCLVFRVKGTKCYEASELLRRAGIGATCCPTGCEECSFYKEQLARKVKILIFLKDEEIEASLTEESKFSRFSLQFAHWEYECAFIVESFRPNYVIVDCGSEENLENYQRVCQHLLSDPRIPDLRILLAVPHERKNRRDFSSDLTVIGRPFTLVDIERHLQEVNSYRASDGWAFVRRKPSDGRKK